LKTFHKGARTTAFKTVRFDEVTLEKYGITVESFDLSELFHKVDELKSDAVVLAPKQPIVNLFIPFTTLQIEAKSSKFSLNYTNFSCVPTDRLITLAKFSVVIDEYIEEYHLDAITHYYPNQSQDQL